MVTSTTYAHIYVYKLQSFNMVALPFPYHNGAIL